MPVNFRCVDLNLIKSTYPFNEDWPDYCINLDRWKPCYTNNFATVGCQGVIGKNLTRDLLPIFMGGTHKKHTQNKIGDSITIQFSKRQISHAFLLGDNFYDDGLDPNPSASAHTSNMVRFKKCFHDIYRLPSWAVLGNHDYKVHGATEHGHGFHRALGAVVTRSDRGYSNLEAGMVQVMHTYDQQANPMVEGKRNWNMPNRYYALFSERADFFCMDSNTFPFDKDQQYWLKEAYAFSCQNSDNIKVLVQHHPYLAFGKRLLKYEDDINLYGKSFGFDEASIKAIVDRHASSHAHSGLGGLIESMHLNMGIDFNLMLCAHDHVLKFDHRTGFTPARRRSRFLTQIISGGGGGNLINRNDMVKILPGNTPDKWLRSYDPSEALYMHGYNYFNFNHAKPYTSFYSEYGKLLNYPGLNQPYIDLDI
tara:strand:- start:6 stop:1271 length:1266 start_codon:yes stop_codon:yes gene_type:complete